MSTDPRSAPGANTSNACTDALELLASRQERTRALADRCRRCARCLAPEDAGQESMRQCAETLCRAIGRMAALEEELLFPAARAALDSPSLVDLAQLEHATARQIIARMALAEPADARYDALVLALVDCVERHACHEQDRLFPRLRESNLDMTELGRRLRQRLGEQALAEDAVQPH